MRNLKFRAWNTEFKEMIDFTFYDISSNKGEGYLSFPSSEFICISDKKNIIMQYVGEVCKDINGVELCEHDICRFQYSEIHDLKNKSKTITAIIIYDPEYARFWLKDISTGIHYSIHDEYASLKIIGNTFQNPELLGDKK